MVYQFDCYELDLDRFELRRDGTPVAIEPQVLSLLALLVDNRGRLVSKDEIHDSVWNGRIVSEAALSSRIRSARQAIGDGGDTQRLIRTVHGKGFRFVADVVEHNGSAKDGDPVTDRSESASDLPARTLLSRPVIGVLPFENLSDDQEQEYFSDAITSDIITNLSKHRWLDVISRNTTFGYKGKPVDLRQLADQLGLNYLVEGSVRRAGNRIRVNAQLTDASSGHYLWSDRYDRELADVFELQDQITDMIAARLEPEIGFAERRKAQASGQPDLQAWDSFHLGVAHFFKFTAEGNLEAQRLLQRSRELDPSFGEAHAWWAYAVVLGMVYWDTEPSDALLDQALQATQTALDLDDRNAVFFALKARVQLARRQYRSAIAENEAAIELNPAYAAAHCGLGDSLAYEGRYEESLERFQKAIDLSPNDPQRWAFYTYGALVLIFMGDYEKAVEWTERASVIPNCQYWTTAHRAVALAYLGESEEAARAVDSLLREKPDFSQAFAKRKLFYLKRDDQRQCYLKGLKLAGVPSR